VTSTPVAFPSRDGLTLEAALDEPLCARDEGGGAKAVLVFCHPHPKMGGTMNAPLLLAVRDELVARGWAVIRFNFRGIGASEGTPSEGIEEMQDAGGAIDFARERFPGMPVAIAGWSFGAAVAVRVGCSESDVVACAAIAPPARRKPGVTEGLPPPAKWPRGRPLLVVTGERDNVVAPADARSWAREVRGANYVEMKGANHFFWAQYEKLAKTVAGWLDEVLSR
jgi:alpha/beta superfamily hydrolase